MKLSIVTSLYYSAKYVEEFHRRSGAAAAAITQDYEIILVDDGSPDDSLALAIGLCARDPRVRVVEFTRNFGHQQALLAGLAASKGDHVFLIDSDLEEAPELLGTFWAAMAADSRLDVVYGVQERRKGGVFERVSGRLFYAAFDFLSHMPYPHDTLTARLMTRHFVDSVLQYPEREMDLWCLFSLAGFRQKGIPAVKLSKGASTYTLRRRVAIGLQAITSFSNRPLVHIFFLGLTLTATSLLWIVYLVIHRLVYANVVEGWTSILVSVWFLGGLILFSLGIIGIYLSKTFIEVKGRPRYIVRCIHGYPEV